MTVITKCIIFNRAARGVEGCPVARLFTRLSLSSTPKPHVLRAPGGGILGIISQSSHQASEGWMTGATQLFTWFPPLCIQSS